MGTRVNGVERTGDGRWRVTLESGDGAERQREVDQLISSAPLGWLVNHLRPTLPTAAREAASALRYRDFLTVALILKTPSRFPDNWLYSHDPKLQVGRVQNFGNWSPEMLADPSMACYGMEYFCSSSDALWKSSDAALIAMATRELLSLGLAEEGDVIDGAVVGQPRSLQKKHLNLRVSPSSGGLVGLIWACQGLRWPDDADFGQLEISVGRLLATPLGNHLFMPPPSPV